jgi:N-glycosylase/DNA lyase
VHILKNLKKFKVIKDTPKALSRKTYLEIEEKLKKFAKSVNIPVAGLDLLFWSMQTGKIFK